MLLFRTAPVPGADEQSSGEDPIDWEAPVYPVLYDNTNGLPTSEANAIVQTQEGFIWIGSYSGLVCYDGNTFEPVDVKMGIGSVRSLLVDSQDRLWIGTNDNGLAMMERGEIRFWGEQDGLGASKVSTLAEASDGSIYVGSKGIVRITPDLALQHVDTPLLDEMVIESLKAGTDGLVYGLTNEDDLFLMKDGSLVEYFDHYHTTIEGITSIQPDLDEPGKLYMGTERSALYHCDPKAHPTRRDYTDITPLSGVTEIQKQGDKVWICCLNGIGMIDEEGFHHLKNLPMNNSVRQTMTDYQGNQWFASNRQGVMKLVENRFTDVFAQYGLPGCVVNSTCLKDDKLFIGTDSGLIVLDQNGQVPEIPLKEVRTVSGTLLKNRNLLDLLAGNRIRSIIRDSQGRLWISTMRGIGLVRYDGESILIFEEQDGLFSDQIRMVCEDAKGRIYVVNTGGLSVIEDERVIASYGKADGITITDTLTVTAAPNGDILLGTNGEGIFVINGGVIRKISTEDGLSSGIIMRIKYDKKRDIFWIVTGNKLAYMTSDYKVGSLEGFQYVNNFDLFENDRGEMWVLGGSGIYVMPTEDMFSSGETRPVHYTLAGGLPYSSTSNSYCELTSEGILYLSGSAGVSQVNINKSDREIDDIRMAIPYVDADGVRIYPDQTNGFVLPGDVKKLTIHCYAFTYSVGDLQVDYCLEGFDHEPVTVDRSELGPVSYTNLPGGSYRFVMTLSDALNHDNKSISVSIEKEKRLFEQIWLIGGLLLGGALFLVRLSRQYWKRKIKALEEQHREEAERQRIGDELNMAKGIQAAMLPSEFPAFPDRKEFDLYASMTPAKEVGGDFYDFFLIDDDHLGLVIADVSGKGIPASMLMTVSKTLIRTQLMMGCDPAQALERVNVQLADQNQSMMFVTVWLAVLELSTGKGIACNAGHENPGLRRAGGVFELLKYKHNMAVGILKQAKYRNREFELYPGDCLFVYTDGVPEAENASHGMFGEAQLAVTLNQDADAVPEELIRRVHGAVEQFAGGASQFDDITMLSLKYYGAQDKD